MDFGLKTSSCIDSVEGFTFISEFKENLKNRYLIQFAMYFPVVLLLTQCAFIRIYIMLIVISLHLNNIRNLRRFYGKLMGSLANEVHFKT